MALTWKEEVRLVDLQKNVILTPSEKVEKDALLAKKSKKSTTPEETFV